MVQLKYNNGSTGIATKKVWDVDTGKQHLVQVYGLEDFHFENFRQLLNDIANIELLLI